MTNRLSLLAIICLLGPVANATPASGQGQGLVAMIFDTGYAGYCALTAAQARAIIPSLIQDAVPKTVEIKDQVGRPCAVDMIKALRVSTDECVAMSPISAACPTSGDAVLHVQLTY